MQQLTVDFWRDNNIDCGTNFHLSADWRMTSSDTSTTISALFDQAVSLLSSSSLSSQLTLQATILMLEDVTREVSSLGLFSLNESISEVATAHIKFLRLPFLLARLNNLVKKEDEDTDVMHNRLQVLEVVEIYLEDFLNRCVSHDILDVDELDKLRSSENTFDVDRSQKIKLFTSKKELESSLKLLRNKPYNELDEERQRELELDQLRLDCIEAQDEFRFVRQERQLLQHGLSSRKEVAKDDIEETTKAKPRFKPVIITKDAVQKTVFGMGYKNLPIYTVQEFYEQRIRDGIWKPPSSSNALQDLNLDEKAREDEEREEELEQNGDDEWITKKRNMDEYKDEHRRGWGNRLNRA